MSAAEDLAGHDGVVTSEHDGGEAARADEEGVGVIDVELGLEEVSAHLGEAAPFAEFDGEDFAFAERQVVSIQQTSGEDGVAGEDADDGVIGGVQHTEPGEREGVAFEDFEQVEQLPDTVIQEDGELRVPRRLVATGDL